MPHAYCPTVIVAPEQPPDGFSVPLVIDWDLIWGLPFPLTSTVVVNPAALQIAWASSMCAPWKSGTWHAARTVKVAGAEPFTVNVTVYVPLTV